jgi:hypothetical protein
MSTENVKDLLRQRRAAVARLAKASDTLVRGSLLERFLPCGKPNCRCKDGHLHGPAYFLTVSYAHGKTRQVYVRKEAKATVALWVSHYQEAWAALEEISRINLELIRLKAVP